MDLNFLLADKIFKAYARILGENSILLNKEKIKFLIIMIGQIEEIKKQYDIQETLVTRRKKELEKKLLVL